MNDDETLREVASAQSADYLHEYMSQFYDDYTAENETIGEFLARSHAVAQTKHGKDVHVLDVACGPSALYWALCLDDAASYSGMDVREDTMGYLSDIIQRAAVGSPEERYIQVIQKRRPEHDALLIVKNVASRYRQPVAHDMTKAWPFQPGSFHHVVSCFGIDHVNTREEFLEALKEVRRVIVTGGILTLATLCDTQEWLCGTRRHACLLTTPESLKSALEHSGFSILSLEVVDAVTAIELGQGYEKMIFCTAEAI